MNSIFMTLLNVLCNIYVDVAIEGSAPILSSTDVQHNDSSCVSKSVNDKIVFLKLQQIFLIQNRRKGILLVSSF